MKDIAVASGAPIGSLYHHFRGGKVQIAREALINAGARLRAAHPVDRRRVHRSRRRHRRRLHPGRRGHGGNRIREHVPGRQRRRRDRRHRRGTPRNLGLGFRGWIDGGTAYFAARGLDPSQAREVTLALIGALEGAFVLARTLRSTEPLLPRGLARWPRSTAVSRWPARTAAPCAGGVSLPWTRQIVPR